MADGYAHASGRAALVNLHSSAGVGHAMGHLFTAYSNNTPLVVVSAGQQAFDPAVRTVPLRRTGHQNAASVRQMVG
ncbi:thiamine pyrophosphate-binding protein [Sphingomonas sp. PB2P19]|uniref:thiamine pyrophosphate-binding protein n=1 Tax=Sphingomonas rhamnosi TaxID=3096156 RepID=UPI002FCC8B42